MRINFPRSDQDEGDEGVENAGEYKGDHVEQDDVREEEDLVVDRGPVHLPLAFGNLSKCAI